VCSSSPERASAACRSRPAYASPQPACARGTSDPRRPASARLSSAAGSVSAARRRCLVPRSKRARKLTLAHLLSCRGAQHRRNIAQTLLGKKGADAGRVRLLAELVVEVGRTEDDPLIRATLADSSGRLDAAQAGHHVIENDHLRIARVEPFQGLSPA